MSARLTNAAREDVVDRVMAYKYNQSDVEQAQMNARAFDRVVDVAQGDDKPKIEALDNVYFQTTNTVRVRTGKPGKFKMIDLEGHYPRAWKQSWPARWMPLNGCKTIGDTEEDLEEGEAPVPFPKAAIEIAVEEAKRYAKYLNEKEQLRHKLEALVHSVTTFKKLYDVWPELAEIVPPSDDEPAQALSVDVKELNRLIPLPKDRSP